MPSVRSHSAGEYYGNKDNAFWWIVGDALSFRRGGPQAAVDPWPTQWGRSTSTGRLLVPQRQITSAVVERAEQREGQERGQRRPTPTPVLPYAEQLLRLTGAGFALWDVLALARVRNSDDASITKGSSTPNDVLGLVRSHPSVRRLVFCSGAASAKLFAQHNGQWLAAGGAGRGVAVGQATDRTVPFRFTLADNDATRACFARRLARGGAAGAAAKKSEAHAPQGAGVRELELIVPPSVSPALARMTYAEKRDEWLRLVFNVQPTTGDGDGD